MSEVETERYCSYGSNQSWTELLSNNTFLSGFGIESVVSCLFKGQFPDYILWSFLHESTHHWCFETPLGYTLSALQLRTRRNACRLSSPNSKEAFYIFNDVVRYKVVEYIMRPLAEGIAVFAEHDMCPGNTKISNLRFCWTSYSFIGKNPNDIDLTTAEKEFLDFLIGLRLSSEGINRKRALLQRPLHLSDRGYLPGYLSIKNFWYILLSKSNLFCDTSFFLSFIKSYFYEDMGLVATILEPVERADTLADNIIKYICSRIRNIINIEPAAIEVFEEVCATKTHNDPPPLLNTDSALATIGKERLDSILSEIDQIKSDTSEEDTLRQWDRSIITRRHLMRIGYSSANLSTKNQFLVATLKDRDIPFLITNPLDDSKSIDGEGIIEVFISFSKLYWVISVVQNTQVLAARFSPNCTQEDQAEFLSYRLNLDNLKEIDNEFNNLIEWSISDPTINERFNLIKAVVEEITENLYNLISINTEEDCSRIVQLMEKYGFAKLFETSKRRNLLTALAVLSLATSNYLPLYEKLICLKQNGVNLPSDLTDLFESFEKEGINVFKRINGDIQCFIV